MLFTLSGTRRRCACAGHLYVGGVAMVVIRRRGVLERCELLRCVPPIVVVVVEPAVCAGVASALCVAHTWKRRYNSSGVCDVASMEG